MNETHQDSPLEDAAQDETPAAPVEPNPTEIASTPTPASTADTRLKPDDW